MPLDTEIDDETIRRREARRYAFVEREVNALSSRVEATVLTPNSAARVVARSYPGRFLDPDGDPHPIPPLPDGRPNPD